jgi:putative transposase
MDGTDASHEQFPAQQHHQAQLKAKANALAESFVDSFKTELIADRVWRTRAQLELATVEYIGWFNHDRLHSALDYLSPAEHELQSQRRQADPFWARTATEAIEGTIAPAGLSAR